MKKYLIGLLFPFLLLAGCSNGNPFSVHQDTSQVIQQDPVKGTQYLLDELNAGIIATATALKNSKSSFNKDEYAALKGNLIKAGDYADIAATTLQAGNVNGATNYINIAATALQFVKQALVARKQQLEN